MPTLDFRPDPPLVATRLPTGAGHEPAGRKPAGEGRAGDRLSRTSAHAFKGWALAVGLLAALVVILAAA